jgi:hypothetical protein
MFSRCHGFFEAIAQAIQPIKTGKAPAAPMAYPDLAAQGNSLTQGLDPLPPQQNIRPLHGFEADGDVVYLTAIAIE